MKKTMLWWLLIPAAGLLCASELRQYGLQFLVLCVALGIFIGTVSIRSPKAQDAASTQTGL